MGYTETALPKGKEALGSWRERETASAVYNDPTWGIEETFGKKQQNSPVLEWLKLREKGRWLLYNHSGRGNHGREGPF